MQISLGDEQGTGDSGDVVAGEAAGEPPGPAPAEPVAATKPGSAARLPSRILGVVSVVCLAGSILLSIWVCAATPSVAAARPELGLPIIPGLRSGPPWWPHSWHPLLIQLAMNTWAMLALGLAGTLTGLAALARGLRPRPRLLLGAAIAVVAVLAVLPPAASADIINYAAYGRLTVLGFNPYVTTVSQADKITRDPVVHDARNWIGNVSVYGPLATAEQYLAAEAGGDSVGRIVFWLKLWNALAFLAVALALDRLLRADPRRRARAHLLWSLNPVLLWVLIASGHIDVLATAFGFFGLLVMAAGPDGKVTAQRAFAAGLLVGAATDIKINFALFILGAAWAARKSKATLLALAGGAAIMVVPAFAAFGRTAIAAVASRGHASTWDTPYRLIYEPLGFPRSHMTGLPVVAGLVFLVVAVLALRYLPAGPDRLPAVRPALALSLAWLLTWPFQRPWYDAMAFCLLALYQFSVTIDWIMVLRLAIGVSGLMTPAPAAAVKRQPWPVPQILGGWSIAPPAGRLIALLALPALCIWYAVHRRSRARPG